MRKGSDSIYTIAPDLILEQLTSCYHYLPLQQRICGRNLESTLHYFSILYPHSPFCFLTALLRYNSVYIPSNSVIKVDKSTVFNVFRESATFTTILGHFHHLQREVQPIRSHVFLPSSSQPLVATSLFSVSVYLPVLDIPCIWSHTVCGLLLQASFTYVFKVHPCCCTSQYFYF